MRVIVERFAEIRRLGLNVKPKTAKESIAVSCTTQFELVFELDGPDGARALCDRIESDLESSDYHRSLLLAAIKDLRRIL